MLVLLAGIFVVHIATVIMLFVSTIANVSRLPWVRHGCLKLSPQIQLADRPGGGCSGEGEEHPITVTGRDETVIDTLRAMEGSRGGTGGSLCLSLPWAPEAAGPQHPSSGRM